MTITNISIERTDSLEGEGSQLVTVKFTDHDGTRRVTLLGTHHSIPVDGGSISPRDATDAQIASAIERNAIHIMRR